MSNLVPEAWHLAETRKFLRRVFESSPETRVGYVFPTYVRENVPLFVPFIAQYALETSRPLSLVNFYGNPKNKHVGAVRDESEGVIQIHSINPDFIEIGAVKLPYEAEAESLVRQAVSELSQFSWSREVQKNEANIFYVSREGDLTAQLYRDGSVVEGLVLLGSYALDGQEILGRAACEPSHTSREPKFDPKKSEATYCTKQGGIAFISPVTGAPE